MRFYDLTSRKVLGLAAVAWIIKAKENEGIDAETCSVETLERNVFRKLSRQLELYKTKHGIPGLSFMASVNGKTFGTSIGFSDVENKVSCNDAVMRIASISKPLTSVAILRLWEEGKLNLDRPVQDYVQGFPQKEYEGVPVTITTRQLLCHTGGIRDYNKSHGHTSTPEQKDPYDFEEEYYIKQHYNTVTEALEIFQNDDLIAKPGEYHNYC